MLCTATDRHTLAERRHDNPIVLGPRYVACSDTEYRYGEGDEVRYGAEVNKQKGDYPRVLCTARDYVTSKKDKINKRARTTHLQVIRKKPLDDSAMMCSS